MANNKAYRGFRWLRSRVGGVAPEVVRVPIASGYRATATVGAAANYLDLRIGDPVLKLSTGYGRMCKGTEDDSTDEQVFGIVMGFEPMWIPSSGKKEFRKLYPSDGITWGTNQDRRIEMLVCPAETAVWEIDVDENTTAATRAAYLALRGENATHVLDYDSGGDADPKLDIGSHAVTATLLWRIEDFNFLNLDNRDPTGENVKAQVIANAPQRPAGSATGV